MTEPIAGLPATGSVEHDVRATLHRIESEAALQEVFVHLFHDDSLATARALDGAHAGGQAAGPLHGAVIAVKGNVCVTGCSLSLGSRAVLRHCEQDAAVVTRLRQAGAVVIGLTAMHEIAFGVTGVNALGTPTNPRSPDRIPGGSSSGSAVAVGAGVCLAAIGTDTGGSVRIPAALCGLVGYKPTFGLLSTQGVVPLAPTLDHVGVIARRTRHVGAIARSLLGHQALSAAGRSLLTTSPLRVGILAGSDDDVDAEVHAGFKAALTVIGERSEIDYAELSSGAEILAISNTIMYFEAFRAFAIEFRERGNLFSPDIAARLREGSMISPADYQAAMKARAAIVAEANQLFERFDLLMSPTVAVVAPMAADAPDLAPNLVRNTRIHNLLGIPTITLPANRTGRAVGIQLAAAQNNDAALLEVAQAWEQAIPDAHAATQA